MAGDVARRVGDALARLRDDCGRALSGKGDRDNGFIALDTALRADELRGIVSSLDGEMYWRQRDGRWYLVNDTIPGRLYLGLQVGRKRTMAAGSFVDLLADLCREEQRHAHAEPYVATFVNLAAVEPYHHPEHELVVWVTAAHRLATDQPTYNLYAEIPDLVTDHDVLYREIPPGAPFAAELLPDPARVGTLPRYQARLLAEVLPRLADRAAAATTDEERTALFAEHAGELQDYADAELLPRVAALLDAPRDR